MPSHSLWLKSTRLTMVHRVLNRQSTVYLILYQSPSPYASVRQLPQISRTQYITFCCLECSSSPLALAGFFWLFKCHLLRSLPRPHYLKEAPSSPSKLLFRILMAKLLWPLFSVLLFIYLSIIYFLKFNLHERRDLVHLTAVDIVLNSVHSIQISIKYWLFNINRYWLNR